MPRECMDVVLITAGFRAIVAVVHGASISTAHVSEGFRSGHCLLERVPGAGPRCPTRRPHAVQLPRGRKTGHCTSAVLVSKRSFLSAPSTGCVLRAPDSRPSTTGLATRLRQIVANVLGHKIEKIIICFSF